MQRPVRLSAVESVADQHHHNQHHQPPDTPFTGLCDCLKQPRRVRPAASRTDEYQYIETRPRRRIRVVHLLPLKRSRQPPNTTTTVIHQPPVKISTIDPTNQYRTSSIFIDSRYEESEQQQQQNRNYDHFQRKRITPDRIDDFADDNRPGIPDYGHSASDRDDNENDHPEIDHPQDSDEDDDDVDDDPDDDLSDYDEQFGRQTVAATSSNPPLPVYGFESPFHPKNVAESAERLAFKLRIFADRLVHVILDEAFLEYGALRELLVLPDQRRNGGLVNHHHQHHRIRRWQEDADDENCDVGTLDGYVVPPFVEYRHGSSTNQLITNGWDDEPARQRSCTASSIATNNQQLHHATYHYDNPTFRSSLLGLDGSNVRGESLLEQVQRVASFRIARSRSSTRLRTGNTLLVNGGGGGAGPTDPDGPPDPLSKFTYSPTGVDDEAGGGDSSSFPSSTWGSSTDSSVRYVRRFLSRKFKTKPLLFFVHGAGDSADLWRAQLDFFRERGYETLAMDLIGHGLSCAPDEPKAYAFHVILTDVVLLFDRFSKERNVVIGHSYGACFAAALARHRPKLVTHLILLSGGGPFPLCPQPPKVHLPLCLTSCVRSLLSCGTRRETFYVPSRKQARVVKNLDIPSYVLKYIRQGQMWLEGDASFHKQIIVPTLLIYGLRDPYVTLVEECEMEKTIPRAFLELIPEASHMIMLDAPNQVNDMIYKFLRRWDR